MALLHCVSADELGGLCAAASAIAWPADRAQVAAIAAHLGWHSPVEREDGVAFTTPADLGPAGADVTFDGDSAASFAIDLTDHLDHVPGAPTTELSVAYAHLVAEATRLLGGAGVVERGPFPATAWRLPSGARLGIHLYGRVVSLGVTPPDPAARA